MIPHPGEGGRGEGGRGEGGRREGGGRERGWSMRRCIPLGDAKQLFLVCPTEIIPRLTYFTIGVIFLQSYPHNLHQQSFGVLKARVNILSKLLKVLRFQAQASVFASRSVCCDFGTIWLRLCDPVLRRTDGRRLAWRGRG